MNNKYPACNTSGCEAYKAMEAENQRLTKALGKVVKMQSEFQSKFCVYDTTSSWHKRCNYHLNCDYSEKCLYQLTKALAATPEPQQSDYDCIIEAINNPQYNENLDKALNRKLVFDEPQQV